jgi:hypothetical protein
MDPTEAAPAVPAFMVALAWRGNAAAGFGTGRPLHFDRLN